MAVTVERLIATLEARIDKYEKNLQNAYGQTDRQFGRIERRGKQMESRLAKIGAGGLFKNFGAGLFSGIAAGLTADKFKSLLDGATQITNALKVAGLTGDDLTKVYDRLYQSAQKNAAPLDALVTLYSRVASSQKELGVSTEQVLTLTDNVAKSVRLTGGGAQEAAGALLQLSQALGGGKLQAEEYNSLIDGLRPLLQAAAAGMQQAGGSVAKLTALVKNGEVSSRAFFDAINAGAPLLDEKLGGATLTVSQGMTQVYNSMLDAARKFDETTDTSKRLGGALGDLATAITAFNVDHAVSEFEKYVRGANDAIHATNNFMLALGQKIGLNNVGEWFANTSFGKALGAHTLTSPEGRMQGSAPAVPSYLQDYIKRTYGGGQESAPKINPIDITRPEYKPIPTSTGGGRRGGTGRSRQNDYQRETEQIKERTAALTAQTAAQASVNPLVDDFGLALETARAKQDLLSAAQKAGLTITPELTASIDALAGKYGEAYAQSQKLAKGQDDARRSAEELNEVARDTFGTFVSDLLHGKSAAEALSDALGRLADRVLDLALDSIFGTGRGGGGGLFGGFLGILGSIFHKGGVAGGSAPTRAVSPAVFAGAPRMHSGGVAGGLRAGEVPAILQRGEVVLPKNAKMAAGGSEVITVNLQTDQGLIADVADQRIKTHSGAIVHVAVTQAKNQVVPTMAAYQRDRAGGDYRG